MWKIWCVSYLIQKLTLKYFGENIRGVKHRLHMNTIYGDIEDKEVNI